MKTSKMIAPFINHTEYDKNRSLHCSCGWTGEAKQCRSTLHAAFVDMACPACRDILLVVDTLGTECGTFTPSIPEHRSYPTPTRHRIWRPLRRLQLS